MVMAVDPNVQVALASIIGTTILTFGTVVVAVINNRKERVKAASAGVDAALDERDVLERMLSLIAENDRKEETISGLRKRVRTVESEKKLAQEEVRMLKAENAQLILKTRGDLR